MGVGSKPIIKAPGLIDRWGFGLAYLKNANHTDRIIAKNYAGHRLAAQGFMGNSNQPHPDLDERTLAFLAVVNCDPSEVRDIPPDRLNVSHGKPYDAMDDLLERELNPPKQDHSSLVLYFGKHKDKKLSEIPVEYLIWLVSQPPMDGVAGKTRQSIERTKRKVCEFLGYAPDFFDYKPTRLERPKKKKKKNRRR